MTGPSALQPGEHYHIFNRGINGENIFVEERNYQYFLNLYTHHIEPVAETFAYCLLKNHFHVLVRIKTRDEVLAESQTINNAKALRISRFNPSVNFANFFNAYAKAINKTYGRTGSLFEHPFHRVLINNTAQFLAAIRYIHQNPQKHGFVTDFREWPFSSYGSLLSDSPTRLSRETVYEWFGGREVFKEFHAEMTEEEMDYP